MTATSRALYVKTVSVTDAGSSPNITITTDAMGEALKHQISIEATGLTGTLALTGVPYGCTTAQVIYDEAGDAVVFDLAALKSYIVDGVYSSFVLDPTSVSAGTFSINALGID